MQESDRGSKSEGSPELIRGGKPSIVAATPLFLTEEAIRFIGKLSKTPFTVPESMPVDDNETVARVGDAEIVLVSPKDLQMSGDILRRCPSLRYLLVCGTDTSGIDGEEANARDIIVSNVTEYSEPTTAKWIFNKLFWLYIGKPLKGGHYFDVYRKTLGIIGLGAMGQEMIRQGREHGMEVIYYSPTKKPTEHWAVTDWRWKEVEYRELRDLLAISDVISIHVPKDTKVLGPEEFVLIKDGAVLVDTSMGKVFEVDDFLRWIQRGRNRAIFDRITSDEYFERFRGLENVVLFDEIAAYSSEDTKNLLSLKVVSKLGKYAAKNGNLETLQEVLAADLGDDLARIVLDTNFALKQ